MDDKIDKKIDQLKSSVDLLTLVEFCKLGAKREDVREVFGTLDNNLFAKVNRIVDRSKQESKQDAKKEK
jgi:hypothetical protein